MDSHGISGKSWILPDGTVIDCTGDEHARYARAQMLNIPTDDVGRLLPLNTIFCPLSEAEAKWHRSRGVGPDCIEFLTNGSPTVDPRVYAIKYWGWIRTRENKFYAWEWDEKNISRLASATAFWEEFAKDITDDTWIHLNEVKSNQNLGRSYANLKKYRSEPVC